MSDAETPVLRSSSNPKVRHMLRMRDNRSRRRAGRVVVDGWRETAQAVAGGLTLSSIYLPESLQVGAEKDDPSMRSVFDAAMENECLHRLSDVLFEKISYGQADRGVVAEFEAPVRTLESLQLPAESLILILDRIEKPGNIGAVFRSADAAGVDAIVLCQCESDLFNPNAIRSSLGAVFRVAAATADPSSLSRFLMERQIRPLAARVESSDSLWESDLTPPLAIILGSEAEGLGERWQRLGDEPIAGVRIPMWGEVDSLNISASAAVIAFEVSRQRAAASA